MIPWIAAIVVTQSVSIQFHYALQLSSNINAYLKIQTIDSVLRVFSVTIIGYYLSEVGILLAMILTSIIKISLCWGFIFKQKHSV
jgi:hypothetical protein